MVPSCLPGFTGVNCSDGKGIVIIIIIMMMMMMMMMMMIIIMEVSR